MKREAKERKSRKMVGEANKDLDQVETNNKKRIGTT